MIRNINCDKYERNSHKKHQSRRGQDFFMALYRCAFDLVAY